MNIQTLDFRENVFVKLVILHLYNTELSAMPISISNIPMLKEFYVNENSIISIQDSYFNLFQYLEILHLRKLQGT